MNSPQAYWHGMHSSAIVYYLGTVLAYYMYDKEAKEGKCNMQSNKSYGHSLRKYLIMVQLFSLATVQTTCKKARNRKRMCIINTRHTSCL